MRPEPMLLEGPVHALEEVGDPADPGLDHDEVEAGVALADAAEDELGDELAYPHGCQGNERLAHARRGIEQARYLHAARALDVEGERDAGALHRPTPGRPHRIAAVGRT